MVAVAVAAAFAAPAAAEIYRWRDASGREHFTTDPSKVPPEHRGSSSSWKPRAAGAVNIHESPARPAAPAPEQNGSAGASAAAARRAEDACDRSRREAKRLLYNIDVKERAVEHLDDAADDITRNAYSRRRWEIRRDRKQEELDRALAAYDAFRERGRRDGIDPGCLR